MSALTRSGCLGAEAAADRHSPAHKFLTQLALDLAHLKCERGEADHRRSSRGLSPHEMVAAAFKHESVEDRRELD
jgi:hypothetical protein